MIETILRTPRAEVQCYADAEALRQRREPRPGDPWYLILTDLRRALDKTVHHASGKLLDYGCGGSPYRPLFSVTDYQRADLPGVDHLDYIITPGAPLTAPDAFFDTILSTQALEHVTEPMPYLRDCYRMLRSGGKLILSTHGSYPDHGAPWDFQRWTPWGMRRDLEAVGFEASEIWLVNTGPRALFQYWEMLMERIPTPSKTGPGLVLRLLRGLTRRRRSSLHRWADEHWSAHHVVSAEDHPDHRLYQVILAVACKP
jgi:SAM-dependent methyltransferase